MVRVLVLQMAFVIQARSEALGDHRAGQLGAVVENLVPMALSAARGQDAAMPGALMCVFSATTHPPNLLL